MQGNSPCRCLGAVSKGWRLVEGQGLQILQWDSPNFNHSCMRNSCGGAEIMPAYHRTAPIAQPLPHIQAFDCPLAFEWAPPTVETYNSLQIILYIKYYIFYLGSDRMMPSANTNVQAARGRPASSQNNSVPRTQNFAYPAWVLGPRGVVHAGSRPSHVVARAKSDDEPDWNAEMSIFQKRISRPNQLATLRELEGKVAVGKVGHACV